MTNNRGKFISFEGGEGAGKSTLIHKVGDWLRSEGKEVVTTHEPGGTALAGEIRKILLEKPRICSKAELLLFLAARAEHVDEVIEPSLKKGKIVLCDRFQDSTVAYQGYARHLGIIETMRLSEYSSNQIVPDLTIYLDIPPEIGLERAKRTLKKEKNDRMEAEHLEFHEKVRKGFLTLADLFPRRIRVLDARLSSDVIFEQTMKLISSL